VRARGKLVEKLFFFGFFAFNCCRYIIITISNIITNIIIIYFITIAAYLLLPLQ